LDSKAWIDHVFDNLDRWRELPAYQLERRADIFFSLYLDDIVKSRFGRKPKHIIPEFPIRKDGSNLSKKMDYLAVMQDPPELVFVELKTDPASMGWPQIQYLLDAQSAQDGNNSALLDDLKNICPASRAKKKYARLVDELIVAQLVDRVGRGGFELRKDFPDPLRAMILYVHPCSERPLFLQHADPSGDKIRDIPFLEVADMLEKQFADDFSLRFAQSLHRWAKASARHKQCMGDKRGEDE